MVKLATARESRTYGPRPGRNRWEYINAALYLFAAILLVGGFLAQLSPTRLSAKSGLAVVLIGLVLITLVNTHDLVAHMAGIDYCFALMEFDIQLALVEFAVPLSNILGSILTFIGVLFFLIQAERGYSYRLEKHALNTLIAGPACWALGSIHNQCQIYERSRGHVQILQKTVQLPFLIGSLLFLVGGVVNRNDIYGSMHTNFKILGRRWIWLSLSGSLLFLIGGLLNLVKVFKMQQMDGMGLEKLRGGAQERLGREREGQVPLILEDGRRRKLDEDKRAVSEDTRRREQSEEGMQVSEDSTRTPSEEARQVPASMPAPSPTPYKDVLVGSRS
ncbi:putative Transcription factor SPEECHLESS [Cocos nucifera]|uniref:Putative Transcription factor SPEECHLESS n=1 Tax=Cocos nucifera TaxID=13894 RepID=A0A8K0I3I1_COCNU|nr:putative Transcription factor SPEECHLESS [Cocos nucifera]